MNTCGRIYLDDPATGRTARCGKVAGHDDPLNHGPAPVEYKKTYADDDDLESGVLNLIAKGSPYVMVIVDPHPDSNELKVHMNVGGGVDSLEKAVTVLEAALKAAGRVEK